MSVQKPARLLNPADTRRLEQESARMEAKLETLRNIVAQDKEAVADGQQKWRHGGTAKPLQRGYVGKGSKENVKPPMKPRSNSGVNCGKLDEGPQTIAAANALAISQNKPQAPHSVAERVSKLSTATQDSGMVPDGNLQSSILGGGGQRGLIGSKLSNGSTKEITAEKPTNGVPTKSKIPVPSRLFKSGTPTPADKEAMRPNLSNFKPIATLPTERPNIPGIKRTLKTSETVSSNGMPHSIKKEDSSRISKPQSPVNAMDTMQIEDGNPISPPSYSPSNQLSANLLTAMEVQNDEFGEVEQFLSSMGLERYASLFHEQGYDCMETLECMTQDHLKELGMSPGHIIKFCKRIDQRTGKNTQGDSSQNTPSKNQRVSFQEGTESPKAPGEQSFLDGEYDEGAAALSFQEAIAAWRGTSVENGKATTSGQTPQKPKDANAPSAPFSWRTLGGNELSLAGTVPGSGQGTQSSPSGGNKSGRVLIEEQRHCCYLCFRQFTGTGVVAEDTTLNIKRTLCSDDCSKAFHSELREKQQRAKERQELQEQLLGPLKKMKERTEMLTKMAEEEARSSQPSARSTNHSLNGNDGVPTS